MLGNIVEITRGVEDFDSTRPYYEKLGLFKIGEGDLPQKWILFSDNRINIRLIDVGEFFMGFTYYNENLQDLIGKLNELDVVITSKKKNEIIIKDPNGFRIIVKNTPYDNELKTNMFADSKYKYGYFGEFAIPVSNFDESKEFWEKVGYTKMVEMNDS